MVTRWAFIYAKDGTLLMVCPVSDYYRFWNAECVARVQVVDAPRV